MKQIIKDAFKSDELTYSLVEVICVDDKCEPEDLTDELIINEARYVLNKYVNGAAGFMQHDEYLGEEGPEAQQNARKNVAALRKFLKKYNTVAA